MAMGNQIGAVSLGVNLDSTRLSSQANQIGNNLQNKFGGIAKKIGGVLVAGLSVKALVSFSKKCLELGSDLVEVQNVVDTVFPTMSSRIDDFAKNAAAQFGMSETMAKKFSGTFGAMASSFGFGEKEALDMSTALTGLAGDVASFYNSSQEEAYTRLKSVFTGETESLKELGVVMTQTALDQFALQNGFGKTTSAMTEQEKVALRYQFVMAKLNNASGDFARTSGSWANQVRLLKLQFESFMATIGQGLIAVLTPAIQALNRFMGALIKVANTFKSFVFSLFGKESQDMTTGAAAVLDGLGDSSAGAAAGLGDVGDAAGGAASDTAAAAKKIQRSLMGFDQIQKLSDIDDSGSGGSGGGSGSGAGGGGTGDLGDTSSALKDTAYDVGSSDGPLAKVLGLLKGIKDVFMGGFWEGLGDTSVFRDIEDNFASIKSSVQEIFGDENVRAASSRFAESLIECIGQISGSFVSIGATIVDNLSGGVAKYLEENSSRISEWLTSMFDIGTEINGIIGKFSVAFADIFSVFRSDDAKQITADIISIFNDGFMGVTELGAKFVRDILDTILSPITENAESIKQSIEDTLGPVRKAFDSIASAWQYAWDKVQTLYDEHIHPIFESIKETLSTVVGNLSRGWSEHVAPVLDKLSEKFQPLFEQHIKPMLDSVCELLGNIYDAHKFLWDNALGPFFEWLSTKVMPFLAYRTEVFGNIALTAIEGISDAIKLVADVLNDIVSGRAAQKAKTFFTETIPGWAGSLLQSFEDKLTLVKLFFTDKLGGTIKQAFIDLANDVIGVINGMISNITRMFTNSTVGKWLAEKLGIENIEEIRIPLIADLDPPAGTQYNNYKKELEKKSKKNPIKADGTIIAKKMDDDIPSSQKNVDSTARFIKSDDKLTPELKSFYTNAKFKTAKDLLSAGDKTFGSKANFTSSKNSLTVAQRSFGSQANFNSRKDSLSAANKAFNTKALFNARVDKLSAANKTFNSKANFISRQDSISNKTIGGFTASVSDMSDNIAWWKKVIYDVTAQVSNIGYSIGSAVSSIFRYNGGVLKNGTWRPIQSFAGGGSPYGGQIFRARENGNPELVGTLRGSTAVMNNDQIVASVSHGVAQAIAGLKFYSQDRYTPHLAVIGSQVAHDTSALVQMAQAAQEATRGGSLSEVLQVLRDILYLIQHMDLDVKIDGRSIKDRIVQLINANTQATGACEIVV